jgi:putative endonuclease
MAKHINTGKLGETLSLPFFEQHGYEVLEKNWRFSRSEVDIIASKDNVLHFIEVKTRRTKNYGLPEDKVDNKKIKNLINAAEEYLYLHPQWKRIQFDILSIILNEDNSPEFFLVEDVYL